MDDTLSDRRQDAVSAVTGIQFCACQSAREQRDDDDDDQNDRLAVETARGALLAGERRWRWWRRRSPKLLGKLLGRRYIGRCLRPRDLLRGPYIRGPVRRPELLGRRLRPSGRRRPACRRTGRCSTPAPPIRMTGALRRRHLRDSASCRGVTARGRRTEHADLPETAAAAEGSGSGALGGIVQAARPPPR